MVNCSNHHNNEAQHSKTNSNTVGINNFGFLIKKGFREHL